MKKITLNKRRLKHGSLATAMTIGLVAVLVLVNVIVGLLVERFPMDIDLTTDNIFQLSDESIEYIENLDQDVTINVLADEETFSGQNDYYRQANEVIQNYTKYSDRITVRYIDLYTNPELQQKYSKETLSVGGILVECGERYQTLTAYDLFNTQTDQQTGHFRLYLHSGVQRLCCGGSKPDDRRTVCRLHHGNPGGPYDRPGRSGTEQAGYFP